MQQENLSFELEIVLEEGTKAIKNRVEKEFKKAGKTPTPKIVEEKVKQIKSKELSGRGDFFTTIAREKLKKYVEGSIPHKTLQKQINIIESESRNYKNDPVVYEKYTEKLQLLKGSLLTIRKSYKYNAISDEYFKSLNIVNADESVKNLKLERTSLKNALKDLTPNSICNRLSKLRKAIEEGSDDKKVLYDYDSNDLTINAGETGIKYVELLKYIASLTTITPKILHTMNIANIRDTLMDVAPAFEDKVIELETSLEDVDRNLKIRISEIVNDNVSKLALSTYDINKESDATKILDMIASSKALFIFSLAKKLCNNYGIKSIDDINDVAAEGNLHLALALNKWKVFQRSSKETISIEAFLNKSNILQPMKKRCVDIKSGGVAHPSTIIGNTVSRNKDYKLWVEANPHLDKLPEEMKRQMFNANNLDKNPTVNTASQYRNTIGSYMKDDPNGDPLDSTIFKDVDLSSIEMADLNFATKEMFKILKWMSTLKKREPSKFDTRTKTVTEYKTTNKYYFNKMQMRILELTFGISPNPNSDNGLWSQAEMLEELKKDYKEITQPTLSFNISDIRKKLYAIKSAYPDASNLVDDFLAYFASTVNLKYLNQFIEVESEEVREIMDDIYDEMVK